MRNALDAEKNEPVPISFVLIAGIIIKIKGKSLWKQRPLKQDPTFEAIYLRLTVNSDMRSPKGIKANNFPKPR